MFTKLRVKKKTGGREELQSRHARGTKQSSSPQQEEQEVEEEVLSESIFSLHD